MSAHEWRDQHTYYVNGLVVTRSQVAEAASLCAAETSCRAASAHRLQKHQAYYVIGPEAASIGTAATSCNAEAAGEEMDPCISKQVM